jgi:hypothetical protein
MESWMLRSAGGKMGKPIRRTSSFHVDDHLFVHFLLEPRETSSVVAY